MTNAVREACNGKDAEGMARSYAGFVEKWVKKEDLDDSLVSSGLPSSTSVTHMLFLFRKRTS